MSVNRRILRGAANGDRDYYAKVDFNDLNLLIDDINTSVVGAVSSVFGRTGAVTAQLGDYTADLINASVSDTEFGYLDGVTSSIQTQLNTKLASASYTAADVLTKIKTVDGTTSGLDADLLDGLDSAVFALVTTTREKLTADRTYYVRTDGSNSNTGLVNNAGGAFLTIQKGLDTAFAIDLGGFNCVVQVADGTYTTSIEILGKVTVGGMVKLQGNTTTPANCIISVTSDEAIDLRRGVALEIAGFKITTATSGWGAHISNGSRLLVTGLMDWGACATGHMTADHASTIGFSSSYTISGSAPVHWNASVGSDIECVQGTPTITISGTPAFSTAFANAQWGGQIESSATYSGTATGVLFIETYAGRVRSVNTLPGDTAGTYGEPTFGTVLVPLVGKQFVLGNTVAVAISAVTPTLQIHGTSTNTAASAVFRWSNDTGPARSFLVKSRGATVSSNTIVASGDTLSEWITYADNGSTFTNGSSIRTTVDGTPGASNDMPTKMDFMVVANGSGTLASALTLRNDKAVEFPSITTTASAANAFLDSGSNNNLLRSTSSLVYKTDIEPIDSAITDHFLKSAKPIWFHSLASADKLDNGGMKSFYSFGAEDLAKIDPRLVNWGIQEKNGKVVPDGVNDRAVIAMLVDIVQRQEQRIQALEIAVNG